jgi:hypothetical protein
MIGKHPKRGFVKLAIMGWCMSEGFFGMVD